MSNLPPELDFLSSDGRIASPERMDRMAKHIASRLRALEATRDAYDLAIKQLQDIGLQRLNEVLLPLFEQSQTIADQLAAIHAQWADEELVLANIYSKAESDAAFAAIDHSHALADIIGLIDALAAKADDAATTAALALKADAAATTAALATKAALTGAQTLQDKTLLKCKDPEFTITDGASVNIDPANGSVQAWVLTANRTPTAPNLANGDSLTLLVRGAGFSATWTTIGVVWVDGVIPTLPAAGYAVIEIWKSFGVTRGSYVGQVTS